MYHEARRLGIHPAVMGPLLALTILLAPIGLLVFLVPRAVRTAHRGTAGREELPWNGDRSRMAK